MTDPNLTPAEPTDQPDHFAEIAAELRRLAVDVEKLAGSGLPKPNLFQFSIQTGTRDNDELTETAVDAWATVLLGRRGEVQAYPGGAYHYGTDWFARGPITASVYMSVSAEFAVKREAAAKLAEREAELEKLRTEVAELRAAAAPIAKPGFVDGPCEDPDCPNASWPHLASSDLAAPDPSGLDYSRADTDADDPTPISPARVPLHTGGVVDGGQLVDETPVPALAYIAPTADGGMVYALKRDVVAGDETIAEPVHYRFGMHDTACGLKPGEVPAATADHAKVTCKACIDGLPF